MAETKDKPNAGFSTSSKGRLRLASRERLKLSYYNDGGKNKGHCTYGYGTLVHRGVCTEAELKLPVSREMAETSLNAGIRNAENTIKRKVAYPLNQKQLDGLVSLTYNVGPSGARDVFTLVNEGRLQDAYEMILTMVNATQSGKKVFMPGLVGRRKEEAAPFQIKMEMVEK